VQRRQQGAGLGDMVAFFSSSPEFQTSFGSMMGASTGEWVEFMYEQVLERESDPGVRAYWIDRVDTGGATKEDLIIHFSESLEFQVATGTGLAGLLDRVEKSEATYAALGNDYDFRWDTVSYWGRTTTGFEVRDGIVVKPWYESLFSGSRIIESWVEQGPEIGSHDAGIDPITVPGVHTECRELLAPIDPFRFELAIETTADGRLIDCGGYNWYIADAPHYFVSIHDYEQR
jgi:hypothetical protein